MIHIHIETQDLPAECQWDPNFPVRGTEEFYVETARHLASSGYHVTVAYDGPPVHIEPAIFVPRNAINRSDILLDCNTRVPYYRRGFRASRRVAWTNFANAKAVQYEAYDALVCISQTHRKMLGGGIVVPHGVDYTKYIPLKKEQVAIYTSSIDRGGFLLLSHRNYIERKTNAQIVFSRYPISGIDKSIVSPFTEKEMILMFGKAKWWIHPGFGVELFCLSGAKAQAAGCIPIFRPTLALNETVRCGYKITSNEEDTLVQAIIDAMNSDLRNPNITYLGMPASLSTHIPSWEKATTQLALVLLG